MPARNDTPLTAEQQALVAQWSGLIVWAKNRWRGLARRLGDDFDSHAAMGLIYAARAFDPGRGFAFPTYASRVIHHRLLRATHSERVIPVPFHRSLEGAPRTLSINSKSGRAFDMAAPHEEEASQSAADVRAVLRSALPCLSPGQARATRLVFLDGLTQRDAAAVLGVTPQAVGVQCLAAMRSLREVLRLNSCGEVFLANPLPLTTRNALKIRSTIIDRGPLGLCDVARLSGLNLQAALGAIRSRRGWFCRRKIGRTTCWELTQRGVIAGQRMEGVVARQLRMAGA